MDTKRLGSQTIRESFYSGAVHGITVWIVYAIVECGFASILPWLIKPNYEYSPVHWGFTALLFGIYPAIGLLLGGMLGLVAHMAARRIQLLQTMQIAIFYPVGATLTLVMAFTVNFVVNSHALGELGLSELPVLFFSLLLTLGLLLSAGSSMWFSRLHFLTNPWTASVVLLGLPWINRELLHGSSTAMKAVAALAYPSVILLLTFFLQKMIKTRRIDHFKAAVPQSQTKALIFLGMMVFVFLAMSFFLKQSPYETDQGVKTLSMDGKTPNVILVTMDTVRADHLSLYGYKRDTTPNLRKFSEEMTVYNRAIASSDITLSTHASIFTGLYATQHGAHYGPRYPHGRPLAKKFHTIAEILSDRGYLTIGIVANFAAFAYDYRLNQGFQFFDNRFPVFFLAETERYYLRQGIRNILTRFASPSAYDQVYRRAEEINREVFALLDKAHENSKPFFLFVNYMDAHWPYIPPSPFDTFYPGKIKGFNSDHYSTLFEGAMKLEYRVTDKEHNHLVSQYDGGIAYVDSQIGKLIERLKKLSLYENSLIIITSDHGEVFGERDLVGHGVSVYQDQVHIPLIIKYPKIEEGSIVDEFVSVVDLLPTILDVLGYEIPENVQRKSLLKLKPGELRNVISESFPTGGLLNLHPRFHRIERAIFSEPYKFISSTAGKKEFYDLPKDPDEKENLYKADDNMSRELEARLNQWLETTVAETETPAKVKLDQDTLNRLKTLGYIQ